MDLETIIMRISGIIFFSWGSLLLIKRKLIVSAIFVNILSSVISIYSFTTISELMPQFGIILVVLSMGALIMLLHRGKHIVYGVNTNMISDILKDILKEERISYEEKESLFVLKDYDDISIEYKKSSDSVSLDLKDIMKLPLYDIIKDEIKTRIEEIEENLFPKSAIMYILSGLGLLIFILYFGKVFIE